jgi:hypothetical protein
VQKRKFGAVKSMIEIFIFDIVASAVMHRVKLK